VTFDMALRLFLLRLCSDTARYAYRMPGYA